MAVPCVARNIARLAALNLNASRRDTMGSIAVQRRFAALFLHRPALLDHYQNADRWQRQTATAERQYRQSDPDSAQGLAVDGNGGSGFSCAQHRAHGVAVTVRAKRTQLHAGRGKAASAAEVRDALQKA